MQKKISYLFLFIFIGTVLCEVRAQEKKVDTFRLTDFFQVIQRNHPVAQQIRLIAASANAQRLAANGSFDPKLATQYESKSFQGKEYFNVLEAGLSIPTRYGVDLKTGFEKNRGFQLNPENVTPENGLFYTKITVPLLQGLLIDERRAILRQAELARTMSVFEMANALNELFYQAGKSYYDWQLASVNLSVFEQAYALSKERLQATRRNAALGDRPGIDTVEANIQMQDRFVQLLQAQNDLEIARIQLSVYLWNENKQPLSLATTAMPEWTDENVFLAAVDSLTADKQPDAANHPYVKTLDYKIKQLEVDRRWKKEKLKPILSASYSPIMDANRFSAISFNQNKWGIGFSFPLYLRKERGDVQLAQIKLQTAQWERDQKQNEIQNKIQTANKRVENFLLQRNVQQTNVKNYEKLWMSEKKLFELGESSLFMINSREMSYMAAKVKLNDMNIKYNKAALEVIYAKGTLFNGF